MKVFGNNFQIPCAESKVPNWKFMIWHFWFPASKKKLFPNTFIWSVLKVPLLYFFKNVSQFLPNQGFRSIQVKKSLFSKGHICIGFPVASLATSYLAISFCFLLFPFSCYHVKEKFGMYFVQPSFGIFELVGSLVKFLNSYRASQFYSIFKKWSATLLAWHLKNTLACTMRVPHYDLFHVALLYPRGKT